MECIDRILDRLKQLQKEQGEPIELPIEAIEKNRADFWRSLTKKCKN